MSSDYLYCYVNQDQVGRLGRTEAPGRGCVYQYANQGDLPQDEAIALAMPVSWEPYIWEAGPGLHPIFEMNMPEGALREELRRRFSKTTKGFDDFELLKLVGPHQLGRLRVSTGALEGIEQTTRVSELLNYEGTGNLFDELLRMYARYSGVSGVQPKVLVRDEDAAGDDTDPINVDRLTHKGATHLIKSWREGEYNQLAANEYFCMRAAMHAGIQVPQFDLSRDGKLLAVSRFDRSGDVYLGHEDMCVVSGFNTAQKYDGTHEGIAKLIKAYVNPSRLADALYDYFKMTALSLGVQNGDAHLKNFGLLYDNAGPDGDVWLSPAYDIVCTTPYIKNDTMALLLAGSKAWTKHKQLVRFGRAACSLTEGMCKQALGEVAEGIAKARVEMDDHLAANPAFNEVGTAMQHAWEDGVARSLLAEDRVLIVDMTVNAKGGR
ncbi:type II toxin-antitoxin system HipA family toxin [Pseudomonas sp.]|uniref:type II toxin-antitoxin system HipA family toxin n=1 Tax=Pseudomonas sp. TaxID=306 RepID=UPI00290B3E28|nr:type II toxin-antitoxin system HipA family toxin [Pseudomonas sp.]MDU4254489.1 type II toxin-antitoxin system HipA family toxin [Pseudomonas sp.]